MTKDGKIVPAFYHAKCGGRILTPKEVWGIIHKDTKVKMPFCNSHGKKSWSSSVSKERIISFIRGRNKRKKNKISSSDRSL